MKRSVLFLVLTSAIFAGLVGCGCSHEWTQATCTTPATCIKCDQTEGEPLGHTWIEATCTEPETCAVCGATADAALGHQWEPATCAAPETCGRCGETQGEPLEHSLDNVGRCIRCGEAIGVPLTLENYTEYLNLTLDAGVNPNLDPYAGGPADTYYRPKVGFYMNGGGKSGYEYHGVRVKAECKLAYATGTSNVPSVMILVGGVSKNGRLESLEPGFIAPGVEQYIKSKEGRYNSPREVLNAVGNVQYDCAVTEISGYAIPR